MKTSSRAYMMATLAALMMGGMGLPEDRYGEQPTKPNPEEEKRKREAIMLKKGMKEFNINGKTVWARDLKNAERKAKTLPH